MTQHWTCAACSRAISVDDTVVFAGDRITHFDCRRTQTLSPDERALLFRYCWDHAVAECKTCVRGFHLSELHGDLFSGREHLCPRCHADLIETVRPHLYTCTMLPAEVRRRAQAARDAAQALVKRGRELCGQSDVLMREAEAALAALQKTMREQSGRRG